MQLEQMVSIIGKELKMQAVASAMSSLVVVEHGCSTRFLNNDGLFEDYYRGHDGTSGAVGAPQCVQGNRELDCG